MLWCVSEDEDVQRHGGILVTWATKETIEVLGDKEDRRESPRVFAAMPVRLCGCHICIPIDPIFRFLSSLILMTVGREARKITRIHSGMLCGDMSDPTRTSMLGSRCCYYDIQRHAS